ncbi:hypothetical protein LTR04_001659 [Oleoguttula sp. CCFEE 6159]|nr:hypothetical protein LTR04_001659 [Oleoguttula sp. CCFEE 6159]
MPNPDNSTPPIPSSVLILGSGVFGLSTALSLSRHPSFTHSTITLVDRSAFPAPDSASIDTSRIIRADYADPAYSALAAKASKHWRGEWGADGRYDEVGLCLVADSGKAEYVKKSLQNVQGLVKSGARQAGQGRAGKDSVQVLDSREEIERVMNTSGGSGESGYVNWASGWADAEAAMRYCRRKVEELGRVNFRKAEAKSLLYSGNKVIGVELVDGGKILADLTVVATGAWSGKLVDLRGIASATGQVLAYLDITQEEQDRLGKIPVLLNMSTGMFVIPPRDRVLKVARHAYGYSNPTRVPHPEKHGESMVVSLPRTKVDEPEQWIPKEGELACRKALREMIPSLGDRPFSYTRICWYTDTPKGDWLITHHPCYEGLFLATGGSGHGFKFLPVIGDKVVDCILGKTPEEFKDKWSWPEKGKEDGVWTDDGSRGGKKGSVLGEEMRKGSRL